MRKQEAKGRRRQSRVLRGKSPKANGELPCLRKYGQTEFWSDHHHRRNAVMVECDDPNYPVIAVITYKTTAERESAWVKARRVLHQVQQQKVDYRLLATRVPADFRWSRDHTVLFVKSGLVDETAV